jgi:hypothetical protein
MYKMLLFLKKTDDEDAVSHFKDFTLKRLSELAQKEVKAADVESNLLLDVKYTKFCEIEVKSKEEWDKMMNSPEGRALNKDLMDFHNNINLIFVDYNKNE